MLADSIDRWNRQIREEGREEGRKEAREEARREGEARFLLRQFRWKFGPLPPEAEEQVRQADADCLLVWSERVLTAARLEEVFQD